MGQNRAYFKGYLFWVDDNFIDEPVDGQDLWKLVFGERSNRVFRLMDMELRVARSRDEGSEALKTLRKLREMGAFVFTLLDLSIPKSVRDKDHHSVEHGIRLSKEFSRANMDFVFLTTNSNAEEILIQEGLSTVPYYPKQAGGQRIPATLAQRILEKFHEGIRWITLHSAWQQLSPKSPVLKLFERDCPLAQQHFPFFHPFKDFVDTWENNSPVGPGTVIVARCPRSHSEAFVTQCTMVILNNLLQSHPGKVILDYGFAHQERYFDHPFVAESDEILVRVIRFDPERTDMEEFKRICAWSRRQDINLFLLPNDESSDLYLQNLNVPYDHQLIYEDLPSLRMGDDRGREELARAALDLVFQSAGLNRAEAGDQVFPLFLHYPEVLLDPIWWTILLESTDDSVLLSDPYELILEFERVFAALSQEGYISLLTSQGRPPRLDELLKVGQKSVQRKQQGDKTLEVQKLIDRRWTPRALDFWLSKAWQFPYGISHLDRENLIPEVLKEQWEDFSLEVLFSLVKGWNIGVFEAREFEREGMKNLKEVVEFLNQEAIILLAQGRELEIEPLQWDKMVGVRWPHRQYPFPAALIRRLKQAGRYLWIESDNLGLSHIFPSSKLLYNHLDDVAEKIHQRLKWLLELCNCTHLPLEWASVFGTWANWLNDDEVPMRWNKEPARVYDSILQLLDNVLPISFMAQSLLAGESLAEIRQSLERTTGYGQMLAKIQQFRTQTLFRDIRASKEVFSPSQKMALDHFFQYFHSNKNYLQPRFRNQILRDWRPLDKQLTPEIRARICQILGVEKLSKHSYSPKLLDQLEPERREALLELILELEPELRQRQFGIWPSLRPLWDAVENAVERWPECQGASPAETAYRFYGEIGRALAGNPKAMAPLFTHPCPEGMEKPYLDEVFHATPLDLVANTLDSLEHLKILLRNMTYLDGYHLMGMATTLRNQHKTTKPDLSSVSLPVIQRLFEMFCYSAEGLIAQLKLLLELAGEREYADRIVLRGMERIELPPGVVRPNPEELAQLLRIVPQPEGYHLYHLGLTQGHGRRQLALQYEGKIHILEDDRKNTAERAVIVSPEPQGETVGV